MKARVLTVLAASILAVSSLIPASGGAMGASAGPLFYVAPASAGGSDSNDCSSPTVVRSGVGPCASLYRATSLATSWFQNNGSDQEVDVYMEPGTYNNSSGFNCSSSAPTTCGTGSGSTCGNRHLQRDTGLLGELPTLYPPNASSEWSPDGSGVIWSPHHSEVCPEPSADDDYGDGSFTDPGTSSTCTFSSDEIYPLNFTKEPSARASGDCPSLTTCPNTKFYADLCGPGSGTFILHTWRPGIVDNWKNNVTGVPRYDKPIKGTISTGWYSFLYHAAYRLMYWDSKYTSEGGWNSFWTDEMRLFNDYVPRSWHIRFRAAKDFMGKETVTNRVLTSKVFYRAVHMDLAWKNLGVKGSYHNGSFLAGVSTTNIFDGEPNGGNHYIRVNGYVPEWSGGGKGTQPAVAYMDTNYILPANDPYNENPFGDQLPAHEAYVSDFLSAIETTGTLGYGGYKSDRMIVYAGPSTGKAG